MLNRVFKNITRLLVNTSWRFGGTVLQNSVLPPSFRIGSPWCTSGHWRWKQHVPLKRRKLFTSLHGVTSVKTIFHSLLYPTFVSSAEKLNEAVEDIRGWRAMQNRNRSCCEWDVSRSGVIVLKADCVASTESLNTLFRAGPALAQAGIYVLVSTPTIIPQKKTFRGKWREIRVIPASDRPSPLRV